jgi:hypothetical protein
MTRTLSWWALGVGAALFFLELLCRVLPVSTSTATGYYFDPMILSYPPQHHWTMSTGWDLRNPQQLESNNYGFVSQHDFVADPIAVALIGDSFVEASMLNPNERPGAQLEGALRNRRVYALGAPGSALLDYAERIRFVHQQFGIKDFVILMERTDVRQSFCGSGNVHGPCVRPGSMELATQIKPPPSMAKKILRESALAQYLISQLKADPQSILANLLHKRSPPMTGGGSSSLRHDAARSVSDGTESTVAEEVATKLFFERVEPYTRSGKLVFVLDCDRAAIYEGRVISDPNRLQFMKTARSFGARVIDLEPMFRAHFNSSPLKFDVGPYDGHFNALGVEIAMMAAAREMMDASTSD